VIFLYAKPARGCKDEREKNRLAGTIANGGYCFQNTNE